MLILMEDKKQKNKARSDIFQKKISDLAYILIDL